VVNAILAAIASFIIPGLGQLLAGDAKKGIIFFVIALVLGVLNVYVSMFIGILSLVWALYAAYDAYQMASA
jgi:TM2 domain-containing membrane protein YozV